MPDFSHHTISKPSGLSAPDPTTFKSFDSKNHFTYAAYFISHVFAQAGNVITAAGARN